MKYQISGVFAYVGMAIFTFGYQASNFECRHKEPKLAEIFCYSEQGETAIGAAFMWPFYWSWELQSWGKE
jgi:hypothetical protein